MTTYARIESGFAVDIQIAADVADLAARYHPEWFAAHPFIVVPDGTLHGAKDNGNGTFSNPTPVVVPPIPVSLTRDALRDYLIGPFGGGTAGRTKVGVILNGFRTSTDGTVAFYWDDFDKRTSYVRADIVALLGLLQAKNIGGAGYITNAEITAVNSGWPVA